MSSQPLLQRREKLIHLCRLNQAIASALQQHRLPADQIFVAFHQLISLECDDCKTKVTGDELFVLSQSSEGYDLTVALRRMRLGFCPNPKCNSYHCTLTFRPSAEIPDWQPLLLKTERHLQDQREIRAGRGKTWRTRLIRPALATSASFVVLFLLHQLYFGGRIPLLREPEKFRVDVAPEGSFYH